jgi:hypothetical protein
MYNTIICHAEQTKLHSSCIWEYKFLCEVQNSLLLKLTFFDMWKMKAQAIDIADTLKEGM